MSKIQLKITRHFYKEEHVTHNQKRKLIKIKSKMIHMLKLADIVT